MSALLRTAEPQRRPMSPADIEVIVAIERSAYEFPWTRGNFIDSLAAGYAAELLQDTAGDVIAYSVAMAGVEEMHLLNLTVAPAWQRRGHARSMLDALVERCRRIGALRLWLEVRAGNAAAQALYLRYGFAAVGHRRAYYPAAGGRREDALVMQLTLGAVDALD